ncbi:hypothetical protein KOW79_019788 [Hemibagrus wyckioides]|uniref:Uncharacterized protein n=1 Tax=Hemibagrus wyckioides TaxID=337641 RepID=A0A9D3N8B8_9TELE|nr:hypothetical protein KOW79_019788 [Hemibagrus wyckioides]
MEYEQSLPTESDEKSGKSLMEERSDSPEPSCVSMKSDNSMESPVKFRGEDPPTVQRISKRKTKITSRTEQDPHQITRLQTGKDSNS